VKTIKFLLGLATVNLLLYGLFTFFNLNTAKIPVILDVLIGGILTLGMAIEYSDSKMKSRLFAAIFFLSGSIVILFKDVLYVKIVMAFILVPVFVMGVYCYFKEKKVKA